MTRDYSDRISPDLAVTFGRLLATWRAVNGVTATAFAKYAGLPDKFTVSRIENAAILVTVGEYVRLCERIGADASGEFRFAGYTIRVTRTGIS